MQDVLEQHSSSYYEKIFMCQRMPALQDLLFPFFFFNNFISNSQIIAYFGAWHNFFGITSSSSTFAFLRIKEKSGPPPNNGYETYSIYKNIAAE